MVKLSKQVATRIAESDLQAARDEADRLGLTFAGMNRILLRAAGRRWLDVRDYMTEPKPSITISPASGDGTP